MVSINNLFYTYATLLKYIGILIPNPTLRVRVSPHLISQKDIFKAMDFVDKMNLQTILVEWA